MAALLWLELKTSPAWGFSLTVHNFVFKPIKTHLTPIDPLILVIYNPLTLEHVLVKDTHLSHVYFLCQSLLPLLS